MKATETTKAMTKLKVLNFSMSTEANINKIRDKEVFLLIYFLMILYRDWDSRRDQFHSHEASTEDGRRNYSRSRERSGSRFNNTDMDPITSLNKKIEAQNKRFKTLENFLKKKKIIYTNFCSVERPLVTDNDNEMDVVKVTHMKVCNLEMFFTVNKHDSRRVIIDNGAPISVVGKPWVENYLK